MHKYLYLVASTILGSRQHPTASHLELVLAYISLTKYRYSKQSRLAELPTAVPNQWIATTPSSLTAFLSAGQPLHFAIIPSGLLPFSRPLAFNSVLDICATASTPVVVRNLSTSHVLVRFPVDQGSFFASRFGAEPGRGDTASVRCPFSSIPILPIFLANPNNAASTYRYLLSSADLPSL